MSDQPFLRMSPHLRTRLSQALESGTMPFPCTQFTVRSALDVADVDGSIVAAVNSLENYGVNALGAAAWIRAIGEACAASTSPDLVWSGPEVPGVHARDTRRVYEALLGTVSKSLWLSTFVFFDGPRAFEKLARRMDETKSLRVHLLLNIQRQRGDKSAASDLVRRFADRFWKHDWPGVSQPRVFYDPRSIQLDGPTGVLHAKTTVADDEVVFVTSANLTEAALDRNYEIGLLSRDRALAASVSRHFQILIDNHLLLPLPGR